MSLQSVLRASSDPTNRKILELLNANSLSAGEIASHFNITQAAVSQHLSQLKNADLVRCRREGKHIYYELNASVLEEVIVWIQTLKGEPRDE